MGMFDDLVPKGMAAPKSGGMFDDLIPKDNRSWLDVPIEAVKNAPESAGRFAQAVAYPILHPIDTATGLYKIGEGVASKAYGALGGDQDPAQKEETEAAADAVGQFFKERYGGMEEIKNTLATDPVGALADLSAVFGGAAALPGRAGAIASRAASLTDPIANAGRLARGAGKLTAEALGVYTGAGGMPIEQAFSAGRTGNQVFTDHMRGRAPATDMLDMAQDAVKAFGKDRGDAYRANTAAMKADAGRVSYAPIIAALDDAKSMVSLKGMDDLPKSSDAATAYNKIAAYVKAYSEHPAAQTAEGLDALKQAIGEIKLKTEYGALERKISDRMYNSVKDQITKQVPSYAKAMKDYSQASEQIDDLTKTFSLGERASKDTAIRKLTSVMRNNVNTNYGERANLMSILAQKQPDLPHAIAGQALNSLSPRGGQRLIASGAGIYGLANNPAALAMLPFASPRLMGEAAYGSGRVASKAERLGEVARAKDLARQAVKSYLLGNVGQAANEPLRGTITRKDVEKRDQKR